jgi:hypothetical protein
MTLFKEAEITEQKRSFFSWKSEEATFLLCEKNHLSVIDSHTLKKRTDHNRWLWLLAHNMKLVLRENSRQLWSWSAVEFRFAV